MTAPHFVFRNSYARLPKKFFSRLDPAPVPKPKLIRLNKVLAKQMGINPANLSSSEGIEVLSGNLVPQGAEPLAMIYAGHQFGHWVPQLGDGRALLLGEVVNIDGDRKDIQLKGSGPTPFSRMGDGRAVLGPVLREYIVSEAMEALGVPTTRALAAVTTGENIQRESVFPGAILVRVASSHVRVGTFQFFWAQQDSGALRVLADYIINHHFPEAREEHNPYKALLDIVINRQAMLIAKWQAFGFIHGVMNTDNTSVVGETIDYGPCAFMDGFHPNTVFSSIDRMGRYSYINQPSIAQWNLSCFAETILPLIDGNEKIAISQAAESICRFKSEFEIRYLSLLRRKLGLITERTEDNHLIQELFDCMAENKTDFSHTFRALSELSDHASDLDFSMEKLFKNPKKINNWLIKWRDRLPHETRKEDERKADMRSVNPKFIPRNHRIEQVINSAINEDDFSPFHEITKVLTFPFEEQREFSHYAVAPRSDQLVCETYCGT